MIYLASPYSDPDPLVRHRRWTAACKAAATLMRDGEHVFSPIAHTHPIAAWGLPGKWEYWSAYDRWFIERCDSVYVLKLDGWEQSVGIQAELDIAKQLGKPIRYLEP